VAFQPEFAEPMSNLTVPVGRDATFHCMVLHLGGYRVSCLLNQLSTSLFEKQIITQLLNEMSASYATEIFISVLIGAYHWTLSPGTLVYNPTCNIFRCILK
jgi:hypothetical protein